MKQILYIQMMVKNLVLSLILLFCLLSCGNSDLKSVSIKSGFINKPGIYYISNSKFRHLIVKEFADRSLIFAIRDNNNEILYQQSLNETFSYYHYWCLYVDENSNVWFYNSDYDSKGALIFNERSKVYELKDFCRTKLTLPENFKKEIQLKSSFKNCISIN